jgi:hypothetical protein
VLVETGAGPVLLAGQAVQSLVDYEHLRRTGGLPERSDAPDPIAYHASARLLLDLAPQRVHFSHDDAVWEDGFHQGGSFTAR